MSWYKRNRKRKTSKRYSGRNRHHLIPKSRGGNNHVQNMLLIDIDRHDAWHRLFKTLTIDEAIELLTRAARMKRNQHGNREREEPRVFELQRALSA